MFIHEPDLNKQHHSLYQGRDHKNMMRGGPCMIMSINIQKPDSGCPVLFAPDLLAAEAAAWKVPQHLRHAQVDPSWLGKLLIYLLMILMWSCEASAQSGCSEQAWCPLGMCTWEGSRKCSKSRESQGLHSINNSSLMFSSSEFGKKFSVSLSIEVSKKSRD